MTHSTVLRLEGRDVLDLLHRLTTAALADLPPRAARATLFCDFRGRLLHRALVARTADGAVWLLRDDAPGAPLAEAIDRQVFRDDVRIADLGGAWIARARPAAGDAAPGTVDERDGAPARVAVAPDWILEVVPAGAAEPAPADLERARVRAAQPRHGHEIRDEFHPLEVGLAREVHLDKGCYPGQEALQRLVTYDSVRRRLARVAGAGTPPAAPAHLERDGRPAGRLTSATADGDGWSGLAVVRRDVLDAPNGAPVRIAGGDALALIAPLAAERPLGRP